MSRRLYVSTRRFKKPAPTETNAMLTLLDRKIPFGVPKGSLNEEAISALETFADHLSKLDEGELNFWRGQFHEDHAAREIVVNELAARAEAAQPTKSSPGKSLFGFLSRLKVPGQT